MLSLQNVSLYRSGRALVRNLSLEIAAGEILVLAGPNGAGKTSLLRLISSELAPDEGQILLDGQKLSTFAPRALAAKRAVLMQHSQTPPHFTAEALAGLGSALLGLRQHPGLVTQALAELGLTSHAKAEASRLSGGEQQRVHFARALVQLRTAGDKSGLLLLDEPLAAQDLQHQLRILEITRRHAQAGGAAVLVLHDLNWAARIASRIAVMNSGKLYSQGRPASVLTQKMLAEVYGVALEPGQTPEPGEPFILPQLVRWLPQPALPL